MTTFGPDVTGFPDDPTNISSDNRMRCWAGGHFKDNLNPGHNNYFCISTFLADTEGKARRRKALFRCTHVITLDDVYENCQLKTSRNCPYPVTSCRLHRDLSNGVIFLIIRVKTGGGLSNPTDGLVAKGLAPDGKDPGFKGVTRYVRLPEGVNTKQSKLVNGKPTKCVMLEWHPERRVSMEALAAPFEVDLNAERRESRVDGAANVPDHPLLQIPEIIKINEVLSPGRFSVDCPWRSGHTGQANHGSAIFTNDDGVNWFSLFSRILPAPHCG